MSSHSLTSLRAKTWTGVPMEDSCFNTSRPTPLLPPAMNTGDLPRYFDAIIVIDLDDTRAMKARVQTM